VKNEGEGKREEGSVSRRVFLSATGSGLLSMSSIYRHTSLFPLPSSLSRIPKVGLQLYTVRDLLKADFEGTLKKVAAIGYQEVELTDFFGHAPADVKKMLDGLGLTAVSMHFDYGKLPAGLDQMIADAHTVGLSYVTFAWIDEMLRPDIDGWKRVAESLNRTGEKVHAAGLQLAYHNHSYEFKPLQGQLPYDVLLANTDPKLVQGEMDLFWITDGGRDPLPYFARYPGRFSQVHVKDMGPGPGPDHTMVDVGKGVIDWKKIFADSEQAGIKHYYVEHDNPPHPLADIQTSYEYLKALEF
jgi:sugar phosphate isomerase/epimerase